MNESEESKLEAVRGDVIEIKGTLAEVKKEVREAVQRNQGITWFQFAFGIGIAGMIAGVTFTGYQDFTTGSVLAVIGLALCFISALVPSRVKK